MKYHLKEIEEAGKPRGHPAYDHRPPAETMTNLKSSARGSGFKRFINRLDNNLWLLSGMTLGITALIIGWWILSDQGPVGTRLFNKAQETSQRTDTVGNQAIEQLEDQLTGLIDRVERLTDSITYLESKLIRAHVLTDSIITAEQKYASSISPEQPVIPEAAHVVEKLPPSTAGQTAGDAGFPDTHRHTSAEFTNATRAATVIAAAVTTVDKSPSRQPDWVSPGTSTPGTETIPGNQSNTGEPVRGAAGTVAVTVPQAPVSKKHPAVTPGKGGTWVINLSSSPSEADADRFAAQAQSRGIETQLQQVTVKGKPYWRVQTTGFSTAEVAQAYVGTVREKLGLKDVWISTR